MKYYHHEFKITSELYRALSHDLFCYRIDGVRIFYFFLRVIILYGCWINCICRELYSHAIFQYNKTRKADTEKKRSTD